MADAHASLKEQVVAKAGSEEAAKSPSAAPLRSVGKSPFRDAESLGFVMDVPVELRIELGRRKSKIGDLLKLGVGSVLELDKANGEALDIYVNDRLIARGEAVVMGERYGVRLTEVLLGHEGLGGGDE